MTLQDDRAMKYGTIKERESHMEYLSYVGEPVADYNVDKSIIFN